MSRRRNPKLKQAFAPIELTQEQAKELIHCARDPKYFIEHYMRIKHPVLGQVPFSLYDYQEDMVDMYDSNVRSIVMSARQTGKTEVICAYILWFAILSHHEEPTILIASNKSVGAMEIIKKIQYAYEELPMWLKPGIDPDSWNKHECRFDNGARIVATATSADSGRGMSISLLYCDELAFVPPNIQEEFWTSIMPTLSTGGKCIISSTPNGDSDLFATLWTGATLGTNNFAHLYVPWDAPPGRDERFKEDQIKAIGRLKWEQEYECKFLTQSNALFDGLKLEQIEEAMKMQYANNNGEPPIDFSIGDLHFYEKIKSNMTYLVGVDVATGSGLDYSVISVVEFPSMKQVLEFRSNSLVEKFIYSRLKNILLYLQQNADKVYFSVENNGVGASILALYDFDENPPDQAMLISDENSKRLGVAMSEITKKRTALKFKNMVETGQYKFKSLELLKEIKHYIRSGTSFAAAPGATDDIIASNLIVVRVMEEMATFDADAYDKIYNTANHDNMQSEWDDVFIDPEVEDNRPKTFEEWLDIEAPQSFEDWMDQTSNLWKPI